MDATAPTELKLPLQGDKCSLRHWRKGDEQSLQQAANNRNIWLNLRDIFPHPYTAADADFWIQLQESALGEEQKSGKPVENLAIVVDKHAVGGIGLVPGTGADQDAKRAELGYWLSKAHWGKGIMSEAVGLFMSYIWTRYPHIVTVFTTQYARNGASARVVEKNGFKFTARLKDWYFKAGEVLDGLMYLAHRPQHEQDIPSAAPSKSDDTSNTAGQASDEKVRLGGATTTELTSVCWRVSLVKFVVLRRLAKCRPARQALAAARSPQEVVEAQRLMARHAHWGLLLEECTELESIRGGPSTNYQRAFLHHFRRPIVTSGNKNSPFRATTNVSHQTAATPASAPTTPCGTGSTAPEHSAVDHKHNLDDSSSRTVAASPTGHGFFFYECLPWSAEAARKVEVQEPLGVFTGADASRPLECLQRVSRDPKYAGVTPWASVDGVVCQEWCKQAAAELGCVVTDTVDSVDRGSDEMLEDDHEKNQTAVDEQRDSREQLTE